jgi:DNA-binding transcriptional LysR family regulator
VVVLAMKSQHTPAAVAELAAAAGDGAPGVRVVCAQNGVENERVALRAFADVPWIAGLAGTQFAAALEQACRRAGFRPQVAHRADDARLFQALVAAGAGIGLLPALACTGATGVRFVEVAAPVPPDRHIDALTRRAAARRPALAATLEALRSAAAGAPRRDGG